MLGDISYTKLLKIRGKIKIYDTYIAYQASFKSKNSFQFTVWYGGLVG